MWRVGLLGWCLKPQVNGDTAHVVVNAMYVQNLYGGSVVATGEVDSEVVTPPWIVDLNRSVSASA